MKKIFVTCCRNSEKFQGKTIEETEQADESNNNTEDSQINFDEKQISRFLCLSIIERASFITS